MDNSEMIEKAEISGIARDVEAIGYLVQELIEDFFTLDSENNRLKFYGNTNHQGLKLRQSMHLY